jgi:hypothetical protein
MAHNSSPAKFAVDLVHKAQRVVSSLYLVLATSLRSTMYYILYSSSVVGSRYGCLIHVICGSGVTGMYLFFSFLQSTFCNFILLYLIIPTCFFFIWLFPSFDCRHIVWKE